MHADVETFVFALFRAGQFERRVFAVRPFQLRQSIVPARACDFAPASANPERSR